MKNNKAPKGMIVDLVTPMSDKGVLDIKGLDSLLTRVLPYASGILLSGPNMGEGRALGESVKIELLKNALSFVQEKIPLFFWITGESSEDVEGLLVRLEDVLNSSNYKGRLFWIDSALYYHSNRDLVSHYEGLVSKTRYPFILYNDPDFIKSLNKSLKRNNIRTNIIEDLSKINNIRALISKGSLARAHNYQKALACRAGFRVYDGDEGRFLEHPSMNGLLSAGANIAPRLWSMVTRASLGLLQEDERRQYHLNKMWETGALLKDLIKIYNQNPVWIIKNTLSDLDVIDNPTCTGTVGPVGKEKNPLTEFLLEHNIG